MPKFLFTMMPANDLGLPTPLVPIARVLVDRGRDVAVFNPAPGRAMAERCGLMVHHSSHGSVMTALAAGTPAVIIPTITEPESNAHRVAALGAGEIVLPVEGADAEKRIDVSEFGAKVQRVLNQPRDRRSARRVAESMCQFGGAREAADRIERLAAS